MIINCNMLKNLTNSNNISKKLFHGNTNNDKILEETYGSIPDALLADPFKVLYINNITPNILSFVIPICDDSPVIQSIFEKYFDIVDANEYKILLAKFPSLLAKIPKKTQTIELCTIAINKNYTSIKFNKIDDINLYKLAIKNNIKALSLIKNHTMELYEFALNYDYNSIKYFKKCIIDKFDNKKKLLSINWRCLEHLEKTPAICSYIVKINGQSIQYIEEATYELFYSALENDGLAIKYINNVKDITPAQKNELFEFALRNNGLAIQYISYKTEELCSIAVQQNGMALQFIENSLQNKKICTLALLNNPDSIRFANYRERKDIINAIDHNSINFKFVDHDDDIICYALKKNGLLLQYINETFLIQNEEKYLKIAVKQNPHAIMYISKNNKHYYKLCLNALKNDGSIIKYIDRKDITDEIKKIVDNPLHKMFMN